MPVYPSPAQIRGARAMLDWSMVDLSKAACVSVSKIRLVEHDTMNGVSAVSRLQCQAALERAGVRFVQDDGEWIGLRTRAW